MIYMKELERLSNFILQLRVYNGIQLQTESVKLQYVQYRICACISRTFFDKNLHFKIGVRLIHGIKKEPRSSEKKSLSQTTETMTPVFYVVKPPVETVSSRHHRLSIDSQKSEDRDINDKLPKMLPAITKVLRMQSQIFHFHTGKIWCGLYKSYYFQILDLKIWVRLIHAQIRYLF
jgi:hypothetical protein